MYTRMSLQILRRLSQTPVLAIVRELNVVCVASESTLTISLSGRGFLKKPGQVIGVFVVVGAVAAAIIGCLVCIFHRRQRRLTNERTHWNFNHKLRPNESILDLPDVPPPRTIQIDVRRKPSVVWGSRPRSSEDMAVIGGTSPSPGPSLPSPVHTFHDIGFTRNGLDGQAMSPSSDHYVIPRTTIGLAVTSGQRMFLRSLHSLASSEPSIYSDTISMSTVAGESESLYSHISLFDDVSAKSADSGLHSPTPPTSLASQSNHEAYNPLSIHLKPMVPGPAMVAEPHAVHDRPSIHRQV